MSNSDLQLSDSEWKVLKKLWEKPHTITQLTTALQDDTGWAKGTIITMLNRLEAKGAVTYKAGEKARVYSAKISRSEAAKDATLDLLNRVYDGDVWDMLMSMVQNRIIAPAQLKDLYALLSDIFAPQQAPAEAAVPEAVQAEQADEETEKAPSEKKKLFKWF